MAKRSLRGQNGNFGKFYGLFENLQGYILDLQFVEIRGAKMLMWKAKG
jgi:hypothetical protein